MKLTQVAPIATKRVLVYGPPKVGKTQLVSTLASKYKLIWFDLEAGYETLLKLPKEQQENIELIRIPDTKAFPIAIETCLKVITGNQVSICDEHGKVSCPLCKKDNKPETTIELKTLPEDTVVVFDSLTQLTNSAIAFITKGQDDSYKMDFSDWGNLRAVVEKFLSQIQQARYHVVCITHEEAVEMENGQTKIVPVCGSSKSSRNTAKFFGDVIYCEVKNKKHVAASSTTYANNIVTGSRIDFILEAEVNPTLLSIFDAKMNQNAASATPGATALNQLKTGLLKGK